MKHIRKTVKDFKYLYYQRYLIKGYFALHTPTIFAIKSPVRDGYAYLRQRIDALQIRDFDNRFQRAPSSGVPVGVAKEPIRGIADALSLNIKLHGREEVQTWVLTKGDFPRIINEETFTEFLACIPIKNRDDPIIGDYSLIRDYYERFIDVYRLVSGDATLSHFDAGLSFIPFIGEATVEIEDHATETFDEIVQNYSPKNFTHNMYQLDVDSSEAGSVNAYFDEMSRAERVGHYLATGLEVDPFYRRIADVIGVAQQVRDHTLVVLMAFPVFETFYDNYLAVVRRKVPGFKKFMDKKEKKMRGSFVPIGTRLKWLPTAICMLGFDSEPVGKYFAAIEEANELRKEVVHHGRQVDAQEAREFIQKLTMCVLLCETSLGRATVFKAPLSSQ